MKTTTYGNFSENGLEFILTKPCLDRPWMNVLSNGNWCDVCSHLGGGYSFLGNPTVGRVTRWHVDGVPRDTVGKFIYLFDEETGECWNANGYPPTKPLDAWRCHIGLGYNRIVSLHHGIEAEITYFTPMPDAARAGSSDVGDPCLIWTVKLTNRSGRARRIRSTSYVELAPGNWFEDTSWREFYTLMQRQSYAADTLYNRTALWVKYLGGWQAQNSDANNIEFDYSIFLHSSAPVVGYEGDRYQFVGAYRDLANPQALDRAALGRHIQDGRDSCQSLQSKFEMAAGESVEYVLVLGGVSKDQETAAPLYEKYNSPAKARAAFENLQAYWSKVVSTPRIETPDHDLDLMVNVWFKYQGAILSWWNRNTGYCYSGIYNFGVRDACQDAVTRLSQNPHWVRECIVKRIMIWQFEGGDYAHGGNFLNMCGTRTFHSDDPLNPLFILGHYVRETGDWSILDEKTPWVGPKSGVSGNSEKAPASIYEHAIAGIEFFWRNFSDRGLPLILKADWNDAMDQMGNQRKGESVMNAGWAMICLELFFPCMEQKGDMERLAHYRQKVATLKETVNRLCWDEDWYWRATHDNGWVVGKKEQIEAGGGIFANPNSFAIIAGVANEDRSSRIFKAFEKYLDTPWGSLCFYPAFPKPDTRVGIVSRFAPGTKENGSIQGHNSRWRIWAETVGGRGDKAYEILKQMLPITRHEAEPELYSIEPYVACQFIYAPGTDNPGEGSHSWATGTACWTLLNVWEHILGVRPEVNGLRIDPCLPSHWTTAKLTRNYRDATYEITFDKPKGICKGNVTLELDGHCLTENLIRPQCDGQLHTVRVKIR